MFGAYDRVRGFPDGAGGRAHLPGQEMKRRKVGP